MTFNPDWVVHPGAILNDWLEEHDADVPIDRDIIDTDTMIGVLDGSLQIDLDLAQRLGAMTGTVPQLWINLETTFRTGLAAGKTWADAPARQTFE